MHRMMLVRPFTLTLALAAAAAPTTLAFQETPPKPDAPLAAIEQVPYAELLKAKEQIHTLEDALSRLVPDGATPVLSPERRAELQQQLKTIQDWFHRYADITPASKIVQLPATNPEEAREWTMSVLGQQAAEQIQSELSSERRSSKLSIRANGLKGTVVVVAERWEIDQVAAEVLERFRAMRDAVRAAAAARRELDESAALERARAAERALYQTTVNIRWVGGRLADLIAEVQKGVRCNVVLGDESVGNLVVPALSVDFVAPAPFFRMLNSMPLREAADGAAAGVSVIVEQPTQETKSGDAPATLPVILIRRTATPVVDSSSQVFDLSGWKDSDDAGIKALVEAVNFALESDGTAQSVTVRYHKPSKLLFAKGPARAVSLVGEVVSTMRNRG
jgi:hypothetical protein